ncbi:class I adenylate-forming enzyme family protein [Sphaerisporangium sp. NPDC005288]|uniref:class I adenylate-forming enzyme family protein n=1 Tax=Sphaerisporangium sp. NPDC005288 TaxID=3155114 RepID=UPI0033B0CE66
MPGLLAARAAAEPAGVALTVHDVGSLTFAEWDRHSDEAALGLLRRGLRHGDRVGLVFGENEWIDYAIAYCAAQKAGGVAVPLAAALPPGELHRLLAHSSAAAVVHGAGRTPPQADLWTVTLSDLSPSADGTPSADGDSGGDGRADAHGLDEVSVRPGDAAQILYTSGTTGEPKAVVASHANLTFGCSRDPRRRPLAHSRYFLHAFPIGTNAGQTMLINALDARPGALTLPRFTAARFARLIETYRVGTVFLVPSMAIELLNSGVTDKYDMSSVLLLGSTAAALAPSVATALTTAFPRATIVNYYTSTEAAPAQTTMVFDPARPDSVGRPASGGTLMISDGEGPVPPGTPGEVWLRSPTDPRSYDRDGDAAGRVFRDGWVRMGDIGHLDQDGYLYLLDRESDIIKSGAFKISTLRIEAALHEHPAVAEAAVFGVPHPVMGSAVAAAVVPRAEPASTPATVQDSATVQDPEPASNAAATADLTGESDAGDVRDSAMVQAARVVQGTGVSTAELRAFLADRLAGHELPARWLVLPSLPKNAAGKVLKRELRTLLATPEGDHAAHSS